MIYRENRGWAEEGSAAAMAVTAAPTGKVNPVAWMSCSGKLRAGFGRHRNLFLRDES
jgi:hypothetical protein